MFKFGQYAMLTAMFLLTGCAVAPNAGDVRLELEQMPPSLHEVSSMETGSDNPKFLSCNYGYYEDAYGAHHNKVAIAGYQYALMASNSYHNNVAFNIPGWTHKSHFRGKQGAHAESGFQADVYEHSSQNSVDKVAIIFRGTDSAKDWDANLAIATKSSGRKPAQYHLAMKLYNGVVEQYQGSDSVKAMPQIILVGHSLGGSLAFHVSWYQDNAMLFAFNPSERKWVEGEPTFNNQRYVLREKGEVLGLTRGIRWFNPKDNNLQLAEEYNFTTGSSTRQHSVYYLARGLLLLAAARGDTMAKTIMGRNLGCEV
ncbi:MAG: hypothetical protein ACI8WB_004305 [Phenylobacterium sp.]|jgi:hypothetical protein